MEEHVNVMQEVPAPLQIIPDDKKVEVSPYVQVKSEEVDKYRDRKSTRLNSSHSQQSRMPSSA